MIVLQATKLRWLSDADQCAHGDVELRIDDVQFVSADTAGDEITLTAAGLYLLRTLDSDHDLGDALVDGNQLFPHCGFFVTDEGHDGCRIIGCQTGADLSVATREDTVALSRDGRTATVPSAQWRSAVLGFVHQVEAFYAQSRPRAEIDDTFERAGWQAFWREWGQRVAAASTR